MLHAQRLTHLHPDPKRIAGYAVAVGFNAFLFMLLLAPMRGPHSPVLPDDLQPTIRWYMPRPVPVVQPRVVPVAPPRQPAATTVAPRTPTARTPDPVLSNQGELVAAPPTETANPGIDSGDVGVPTQPPLGMRLEYAHAPAPSYPRAAQLAYSEGTVLLEVLVDIDGRPLRVDIRESSGDRRLDTAARAQVLAHWRFRPATLNGQPVQALGLVPINFKLH